MCPTRETSGSKTTNGQRQPQVCDWPQVVSLAYRAPNKGNPTKTTGLKRLLKLRNFQKYTTKPEPFGRQSPYCKREVLPGIQDSEQSGPNNSHWIAHNKHHKIPLQALPNQKGHLATY